MKESYAVVTRLKTGESLPSSAETDFVRNSSGEMFTPTGQKVVHEGNINTVLASAGGAGWEKVQITTAAYHLTPSSSGASRDFHVEAGGSLATLVVADWPIPVNPKVNVFKIRNFSGGAVVFTVTVGAGQFSGIVTTDDDTSTPAATSYSIRNDGMVVVSIDSDGWVQVVPSVEVSQAEFDAGLAGKSDTTHNHTGTYEPANTNIQTHVTAAHAPATAEANVQSDWDATTGDELILNKPTIPAASVAMAGATALVAGTAGLVPQPLAGEQNRFLRADGNWRAVGTTESIPVAGAPYSNLIKTLTATPATDNFGGGAFTIRQAITSPILGASTTGTTKARMRVKSGSVAMVIVEAYIGIRGVGDAFASTPTQVFFNGQAGVTVSVNTEILSDIASFALAAGNDVMLSFYMSSGKFSGSTGVGTGGTAGVQPYYLSNSNQAATLDPTMGVANAANETYALNLEVYGVAETLLVEIFADNAAAAAGGILIGQLYMTATGQLMVRY